MKRALMIHHNPRVRRHVADRLAKSGWKVFEAEGRTNGLRLLFDVSPNLVFLEVIAGLNESWDTLRSIRLFTSAPVIVLAEQSMEAIAQSAQTAKSPIRIEPVSTGRVIAIAKAMDKFSNTSSGKRYTKGKTFVASLQGLTEDEAQEADRSLRQICDGDDVRLILRGGRIQRFAKLPKGAPDVSVRSH